MMMGRRRLLLGIGLALGLIYLLVVLFAPHGIVGAIQARLPSWLYRGAKP